MIWRALLAVLLGAMMATTAWAETPVVPTPHLYLSPTAGIVRWDAQSLEGASVPDRAAAAIGGRVGYAPIEAFSAEAVVLTGSNDVTAEGKTSSVTLTTADLSFLVNFRTLVEWPAYPFLDLGVGASFRRGTVMVDDENVADNSHLSFHIGGGVRYDLAPRWGLRLNLRDSFYSDTQLEDGREEQVTVDAVELSGTIEYRIPLGRGSGPKRLR